MECVAAMGIGAARPIKAKRIRGELTPWSLSRIDSVLQDSISLIATGGLTKISDGVRIGLTRILGDTSRELSRFLRGGRDGQGFHSLQKGRR